MRNCDSLRALNFACTNSSHASHKLGTATNLRLGSCSTTDSRKSWGVMYSWPSYSTDANLMKRRSREVSFTARTNSSSICNRTHRLPSLRLSRTSGRFFIVNLREKFSHGSRLEPEIWFGQAIGLRGADRSVPACIAGDPGSCHGLWNLEI